MLATARLNFCASGGDFFGAYLTSGVSPIGGQFDVEPVAECCLPTFVHDPFYLVTCNGIGAHDVSSKVAAGVEQRFRGNDPVDEPPPGGGFGVEVIAG